MKPRIPITSREFRYVASTHTDLRATFARVRLELADAADAARKAAEAAAPVENVRPIGRKAKA